MKKTMKKIRNILAIVVCLLGLHSCADEVLNLEDPGAPTEATFFQTAPQLEIALSGVYEALNYVRTVPFPQLLDHATDYAFNRGNVGGTVAVTTGGLTSTETIVNEYWNNFYTGIQRANNLLNNMEKAREVTEEDRFNEIRAEALFVRALLYSYLTELFGDVPYRTTVATTLDDLAIPRTPKAEIVGNIIADLEEAASILPSVQPAGERGRASAHAANALIARIALYNGDYTLAESAALKVMEAPDAPTLFPDYESMFTKEAAVGSPEVLFDLSYVIGTKTHELPQRLGTRFGGWCQLVPSQQLVDSYETINGLPIDEDPEYDPTNPYENRDPRLKASIVVPGEIWTGHIIHVHSDSIATWRLDNGERVERVFNPNASNPGGRKVVDSFDGKEYTTGGANRFVSFTGYFWKKFADEEGINSPFRRQSEQPVFLLRFTEVLLTYAEARIEAGKIDESVLEAINKVRERAYNGSDIPYPAVTTTDQAALRRILRRERMIEFTMEGLRLFDVKRWGIADKVLSGTLFGSPANGFSKIGGELNFVPDIDEDGFISYVGAPSEPRKELGDLNYRELEERVFEQRHYLWPIPQAEIDASGGLVTQNPGY